MTVASLAVLLGLASWAGNGPSTAGGPRYAVAVLPSGAEMTLEIAADESSRALGYMFREKVGPREGMLFVFDHTDRYSFWMKNCRVSLDMIWLDDTLHVVDIAHDRPPCRAEGDCPLITPLLPGRYVLEFVGGTATKEKLKRGDRIVILSEPPLP